MAHISAGDEVAASLRGPNLPLLRELVVHHYGAAIEASYGQRGMAALRVLTKALDPIHAHLAYELLGGGLVVATPLDPGELLLPSDRSLRVDVAQLPGLVQGEATLQVQHDGRLILLREASDHFAMAERAIVYRFDGRDNFVAEGRLVEVPNPTGFPSVWGVPTFFTLQGALEHYREEVALRCRCDHLRGVWHDRDRRWLLANKPEDELQNCLHQYLVNTLREHKRVEVRREQPVGGRKPPDIKVTWNLTNRLAYIEVKWMGASVHANEPRVSWRPDEQDARDGAAQLADYLDANVEEAPGYQTMGFLAVFDGRREGVDFDTTTLSRAQALYYLNRDVNYDPDFAAIRHDFAPPFRFFMYPLEPSA